MDQNRIIILCNNRIAIPAIQELNFYGDLAAVIVPDNNDAVKEDVTAALENSGTQKIFISRENLKNILNDIFLDTGAIAGFIMTFPFKLDKTSIDVAPRGFYNFHYGRLPAYRGPEPIFAQLKNREKLAAVTVHELTEKIDGGAVVLEEKISINDHDTYGILQSRLAKTGARLANQLVKMLNFTNTIPSKAQNESLAAYQLKPALKDVMIDWQEMDSLQIQALINACNPWNKGAGTRINEKTICFLEVEIYDQETPENIAPGTVLSLNSGGLIISTKDRKALKVNVIYCPEGFMSGHRLEIFGIKKGDRFD